LALPAAGSAAFAAAALKTAAANVSEEKLLRKARSYFLYVIW
jgi:hypothetical protein